ncbi:MAG: hypothetical protein IH623_02995 [Verrucomicrobia bacterium]|nr:hypothetical protein [Verrucomicrobiota bacterium]
MWLVIKLADMTPRGDRRYRPCHDPGRNVWTSVVFAGQFNNPDTTNADQHLSYMKIKPLLFAAALLAASLTPVRAASILQPADGSAIGLEADNAIAIITNNLTRIYWVSTNDATASGGTTLICAFTNTIAGSQAGRPNSFVTYPIRFSQAGVYYAYLRWRADAAVVTAAADNFLANSCFFPNALNLTPTPGDSSQMFTVSANGVGAPTSLNFQWTGAQGTTYIVDEPGELNFVIGDREPGFILDRIVLSADNTLTPAQLDAVPNALTSVIPQGLNETFIAFEADRPQGAGAIYANNLTRIYWVSTNDVTASGGTTLICAFTNTIAGSQAGRPNSFVTYPIRFSQAGVYYVYLRWRANAAVVTAAADNFLANSCFFPNALNHTPTPGDSSQMFTVSANGVGAPTSLNFQWTGAQGTTYVVDEPGELNFVIGDREPGFILDRIVLSADNTLTPAQLDALPNSGGLSSPPKVLSVSGTWGNQTVTVTFSEPLSPATVVTENFNLSGGVTVTAAELNPGNPTVVRLTTTDQSQETAYTLTVNNVTSAISGQAIPAGTTASFIAWKLVSGWVLQEVFFGTAGNALGITEVNSYANNTPDRTHWVKGFRNDRFPDANQLFTRMTARFTPPTTGTYSIYAVADNDAHLFYSEDVSSKVLNRHDSTPELIPLAAVGSSVPPGRTTGPIPPFYADGAELPAQAGPLTAGTPYVLQAIHRQVNDDTYFALAADVSTSATPPEQLPALGGNVISAWVNPSLGQVTFTRHPSNTTAAAHSRATFTVAATSPQSPIYYQWRSNGVDIVGANRATYITPVLDASYNGAVYSVLLSVAGRDTLSGSATLTVTAGSPPNQTPYLGINFAGGKFDVPPAPLTPHDVAGVVPQANWNNLFDYNFDGSDVLVDATGNPSAVVLVAAGLQTHPTGTKQLGDADAALLNGYVGGLNSPITFTLSGLPSGNYNLLAYSVGFSFNATYEQSFELSHSGGQVFPTLNVKGQTGVEYLASPVYVRINSTDPDNRTHGNYVQFDNVVVGTGDTLTLTVTPESPIATQIPAINAIQLVQVLPSLDLPNLTITRSGGNLTVAWPASAAGYVLESRTTLTPGNWTIVGGTPNPITTAGSVNVPAEGESRFYRLRKL